MGFFKSYGLLQKQHITASFPWDILWDVWIKAAESSWFTDQYYVRGKGAHYLSLQPCEWTVMPMYVDNMHSESRRHSYFNLV